MAQMELEDDFLDKAEIEEKPDGSAVVRLPVPYKRLPQVDEHFGNLAEEFDQKDQDTIAARYHQLFDLDRTARAKRDKMQADYLKKMGMDDAPSGGADFEGASKVVHPMIMEACVDLGSRLAKELLPPDAVVKMWLPGKPDMRRIEKADRKARFMNWQLVENSDSFMPEMEQMFTQLGLGGSQFIKVFYNRRIMQMEFCFIPVDNMLIPWAAASFHSAERRTHEERLTEQEYIQRADESNWINVDDVGVSGLEPEPSESEQQSARVEGKEETGQNEDGSRKVYTCLCIDDFEEEGEYRPYIVNIDDNSQKLLGIYRNWLPNDPLFKPVEHFIQFTFVPWRGPIGAGFPQLIGQLNTAATGALRALLDSAHINNFPGGMKLKGKTPGQSPKTNPGEITEIEAKTPIDDIRKLAMPLPINPPSTVLLQLLGLLTDMGKGVVRTSLEDMAEQNTNVPVGTTLARVEQGLVVYKAIFTRNHKSFKRLLKTVHDLNSIYIDNDYILSMTGEQMAKAADFQGPMDVCPVSDPNIFTETQRISQVNILAQRAQSMPQMYNVREVEKLLLKYLKVPEGEKLLAPQPQPYKQNAVNENVSLALNKPVVAFPDQDHMAHLLTHLPFLDSPIFGESPIMMDLVMAMVQHIKEHITYWYVTEVYNQMLQRGQISEEEMKEILDDPELGQDIDHLLMNVSVPVLQEAERKFQPIMPMIAKAMQKMSELQQQMQIPKDPVSQVAMMESQRRAQADQAKQQTDQQKLQLEAQKPQIAAQVKVQEIQMESQARQQEHQDELQMQTAESQHKMQLEAMQQKAQNAMDLQRMQMELKMETAMETMRTAMEARLKQMEADNKVAIEHIKSQTAIEVANIKAGTDLTVNREEIDAYRDIEANKTAVEQQQHSAEMEQERDLTTQQMETEKTLATEKNQTSERVAKSRAARPRTTDRKPK